MAHELSVQVNANDKVTALLYPAAKKTRAGVTIILGHGAGANQSSSFMQLFAGGLAERGLDAMTFNFVYTELGRSVPDSKVKLEACIRAVIETALKQKGLKGNRLVIGGKSMGGRIASQVAAEACEKNDPLADQIAGIVFLGCTKELPTHSVRKCDFSIDLPVIPCVERILLPVYGVRVTQLVHFARLGR